MLEDEPLVSIITPCLNAARFIEATIESVLSQDYKPVEYIVMDGGSTDGTVDILERYSDRLTFISAPDGGAADAINRGFQRSRGSIFAWLNADDLYLPGTLRPAVRELTATHADVLYGDGIWIDESGRKIGDYPTMRTCDAKVLGRECGICQPSTLMRRQAFEAVGMLNPSLHYAFDYDLWIRLAAGYRLVPLAEVLAASRMHKENKSLGNRKKVFGENIALLQKYYGYVPVNWVYGYLSFLNDGRDQFFEPLEHSASIYLQSLAVGSYYNWRHMARYWYEWGSRLRRGLAAAR